MATTEGGVFDAAIVNESTIPFPRQFSFGEHNGFISQLQRGLANEPLTEIPFSGDAEQAFTCVGPPQKWSKRPWSRRLTELSASSKDDDRFWGFGRSFERPGWGAARPGGSRPPFGFAMRELTTRKRASVWLW